MALSRICSQFLLVATAIASSISIATAAENPRYLIKTSEGDIAIELFADKAPVSSKNFAEYANSGAYDGTIFHRVIKGFMIQGGGFDAKMKKKPTQKPIDNESSNGLLNKKYTLAMARTSSPHSATNQFFINTEDNGFLNRAEARDGYGYAVFGKVIDGTKVVDKIESSRTKTIVYQGRPMPDFPTETITILSVKPLKAK